MFFGSLAARRCILEGSLEEALRVSVFARGESLLVGWDEQQPWAGGYLYLGSYVVAWVELVRSVTPRF